MTKFQFTGKTTYMWRSCQRMTYKVQTSTKLTQGAVQYWITLAHRLRCWPNIYPPL